MNDQKNLKPPSVIEKILADTTEIGFHMTSEVLTGSLLKTLAASKPAGTFLELGTGTGVSTAWLLDGMDKNSQIVTVESDRTVVSIAQKHLGQDQRLSFRIEDAGEVLEQLEEAGQQFDLIFADAWVGKYSHLEVTLHILKAGGLYVIDDMLRQTNWMKGHKYKVASLIAKLEDRQDLLLTKLNWASGIIIAVKQA